MAGKERDVQKTEVEFEGSGTVFCSARGDFTDTVKPLVAFFFQASPEACGGQPF